MSHIDWLILVTSLVAIVVYGVWKGRGSTDIKGYLLADRNMSWLLITVSVMATQASAITFISTPGQAFTDGMRFIQFYLGLPVAMVVLSITAVPLYQKLKVFTAYEYLESRFDLKTRALAAVLFLIQRGLAAGLTIYAPAIILSTLLGWNIYITNMVIGILVIIYTTSGGTKAVSWTQSLQMIIIIVGMLGAFYMIFNLLPSDISWKDSLFVAGKMGKLKAIDFDFDLANRYNFWSGLIGGFFLALSYFGTDQSQVQRYLGGKSIAHSRMGLLANGLVKVPMQFFILLIGVMVFVFYQFAQPPLHFNSVESLRVKESEKRSEYLMLEEEYAEVFKNKRLAIQEMVTAKRNDNDTGVARAEKELLENEAAASDLRNQGKELIQAVNPGSDGNDTNYIFLTFVINFLPKGLIGLIIAAIFAASMSSTASELNSLASTTIIDIYKRLFKKDASDKHYLRISKGFTVVWGCFAILFAQYANRLGTLIEAVNILGSLFYGTILGIFLVSFYLKFIRGSATFYAALLAELIVFLCFSFTKISYLWYNVIGCLLVITFALLFHFWQKTFRSPGLVSK